MKSTGGPLLHDSLNRDILRPSRDVFRYATLANWELAADCCTLGWLQLPIGWKTILAGGCRAVTQVKVVRSQGFDIRSQTIGITNRCKRVLEIRCLVPQNQTLALVDLFR